MERNKRFFFDHTLTDASPPILREWFTPSKLLESTDLRRWWRWAKSHFWRRQCPSDQSHQICSGSFSFCFASKTCHPHENLPCCNSLNETLIPLNSGAEVWCKMLLKLLIRSQILGQRSRSFRWYKKIPRKVVYQTVLKDLQLMDVKSRMKLWAKFSVGNPKGKEGEPERETLNEFEKACQVNTFFLSKCVWKWKAEK